MGPSAVTTFAFVEAGDFGKPNAASRQLIRSHCMLGKNMKKRPSGNTPKSKGAIKPRKNADGSPCNQKETLREKRRQGLDRALTGAGSELRPYPPPSPGDLNVPKFAFDIDHRARDVLFKFYNMSKDNGYPIERCVEFDFQRALWFQWLTEDRAFLQLILAYSSVMQDLYLDQRDISKRTLGEMKKTIALLNQHLSDAAFCQRDSTISVIMGLTAVSDFMGDSGAVAAHTLGLRDLLKLRGGLHNLRPNMKLYLKLCIMDMSVNLTSGSPPPFGRGPVAWTPIFDKSTRPLCHNCDDPACSLVTVSHLSDPRLVAVFCDLQHLARLMNVAAQQSTARRMRDAEFLDTMVSVQYRLLGLQDTQDDTLAEGLRLAMLCFLTTAFHAAGKRPAYHYLRERLAECCIALEATPEVRDLLLWMLIFGGIAVFEGHEPWLLDVWKAVAPAEADWPELRRRLQCIIWVNVLHDHLGERVFTFFDSVRKTGMVPSLYNPMTDSSPCESIDKYRLEMMLPAAVRRDRF